MKKRWTINVMLVVLTAGLTQIGFGAPCIWTCKNGIEWAKTLNPPDVGQSPSYDCWYHSTPVGQLIYNDESSHDSRRSMVVLKRQKYPSAQCDPGCDAPAYPVDARGTISSTSSPNEDINSWECWTNSQP